MRLGEWRWAFASFQCKTRQPAFYCGCLSVTRSIRPRLDVLHVFQEIGNDEISEILRGPRRWKSCTYLLQSLGPVKCWTGVAVERFKCIANLNFCALDFCPLTWKGLEISVKTYKGDTCGCLGPSWHVGVTWNRCYRLLQSEPAVVVRFVWFHPLSLHCVTHCPQRPHGLWHFDSEFHLHSSLSIFVVPAIGGEVTRPLVKQSKSFQRPKRPKRPKQKIQNWDQLLSNFHSLSLHFQHLVSW